MNIVQPWCVFLMKETKTMVFPNTDSTRQPVTPCGREEGSGRRPAVAGGVHGPNPAHDAHSEDHIDGLLSRHTAQLPGPRHWFVSL